MSKGAKDPRPRSAKSKGRRGVEVGGSRAKVAWRVSEDVIARRLDEEVILVQLKTDRVYALNHTAARIWELLASGADVREIERTVAKEFAVDSATLKHSIARLLSMLNSRQLVDSR